MLCPCGSEKNYDLCCQPVISGDRVAETATELMRARYSAYAKVEMDFLSASLHPDAKDENDMDSSQDWAENSEWHGLEILEARDGGPDDDTGLVEFVAVYTYQDQTQRYHEVADFGKVDGKWYFKEGKPGTRKPVVRDEPKIGRNDPCTCGSGKKFKKCCG